jgi:hypothetical protein
MAILQLGAKAGFQKARRTACRRGYHARLPQGCLELLPPQADQFLVVLHCKRQPGRIDHDPANR